MKVTFVAVGTEQLSISLLSGIAKREGHHVSLAYSAGLFHDRYNLEIPSIAKVFEDTDEVIATIKKNQPDVLAFSVLTSSYQWALYIARVSKLFLPNVTTIFGGVHISASPDRAIKKNEIDYLVVGEGDLAFPQILNSIKNGKNSEPIPNTWFKDNYGNVIKGKQVGFNQDLDSLPPFDKTIWEDYIRIADKYMTMASRGCPYRCSFCFNNFYAKLPEEKGGKYVRFRSVDHMISELLYAKKRYGNIKYIDFQDDVFTANKKWLRKFVARYKKEVNIPFQCLTHPKYLDEEVGQLLQEAGCKWIQMGVQSMDEGFKQNHLQRFERSDHIVEACRVMNKYGIRAKLDHMFGLPDEPIEAQEKARQLYAEYVPKRIQTFWTCYLPGTDLLKEALQKGVVTQEDAERLYEGIDFYFYRNEDNIKNPELIKTYKAFEFIFKVMPVLGKNMRKKLKPKHVIWIPLPIRVSIAKVIDVFTGLRFGNPDFGAYFKYYLFHLMRFLIYKLTGRKLNATTPNPLVHKYEKKAVSQGMLQKKEVV